ncbi:tRNA adenosine deaminase-associated protein [Propionimicrobium sp. PCR01-08-3]|uniref:tRNA adenosine deaminase-associated protein n=1 Tax=Propionimicrobium sp. PCR01-08-3 TaxID=3052086 RepID=UPI00255CFBAB|nr:tRNA adenosine deaminase-associated protein [Propionimicrobium sp. PCR01-08-3]WIY82741.1 tRNA adenosine deaminase-associated protein [Propionimicrobium sp. PCR01-08-3]
MSADDEQFVDAESVDTDDLGEEFDDHDADLDGGIVPDDYDELDDEEDDGDFDDDDDDYDDDYEDATEDEVDFVVALYREDGVAVATELSWTLANDLDELCDQLRRLPGDAGALGLVSVAGQFFVLCRVRGRTVQVLLSDSIESNDWPIARDVIDYLGMEVPDPDDDSDAVGDFDMLADQGVSEFDMEQIASDPDEDSDQLVRQIVDLMRVREAFEQAVN